MTEPETDSLAPGALAPDAEPTGPSEPNATGAEAEPETDALARAESDAAAEAEALPNDDVLTSNDYTVAFSPRQVAVGLAIVAGLIAVVAARRRGRKRSDGGG